MAKRWPLFETATRGASAIECAYCAGYSSARGLRSWKDRMRELVRLGFIRVAPRGPHEFGYVLIRHPYLVISEHQNAGRVPLRWWNQFRAQLQAVGAAWPELADVGTSTGGNREQQVDGRG